MGVTTLISGVVFWWVSERESSNDRLPTESHRQLGAAPARGDPDRMKEAFSLIEIVASREELEGGNAAKNNHSDDRKLRYLEDIFNLARNQNLSQQQLEEILTFLLRFSPESIAVFRDKLDATSYDPELIRRLDMFVSNLPK